MKATQKTPLSREQKIMLLKVLKNGYFEPVDLTNILDLLPDDGRKDLYYPIKKVVKVLDYDNNVQYLLDFDTWDKDEFIKQHEHEIYQADTTGGLAIVNRKEGKVFTLDKDDL